MNDRRNAPVEPHDDGTVQDEPEYQTPSEGIVTDVAAESRSDFREGETTEIAAGLGPE